MTPCKICGRLISCACTQPATTTDPSELHEVTETLEVPLKIRASAATTDRNAVSPDMGWTHTVLSPSTLGTQSIGTGSVTEAPVAQGSSTQQVARLAVATEPPPAPLPKVEITPQSAAVVQAIVAEVPPVPHANVPEPVQIADTRSATVQQEAADAAAQPAPGPPPPIEGIAASSPQQPIAKANAAHAPQPAPDSFRSFSEWAAATHCFERSRSNRAGIASRVAMAFVVVLIACAVVGYMFGLLPLPPDTSRRSPQPQVSAPPVTQSASPHGHHKPHASGHASPSQSGNK